MLHLNFKNLFLAFFILLFSSCTPNINKLPTKIHFAAESKIKKGDTKQQVLEKIEAPNIISDDKTTWYYIVNTTNHNVFGKLSTYNYKIVKLTYKDEVLIDIYTNYQNNLVPEKNLCNTK